MKKIVTWNPRDTVTAITITIIITIITTIITIITIINRMSRSRDRLVLFIFLCS